MRILILLLLLALRTLEAAPLISINDVSGYISMSDAMDGPEYLSKNLQDLPPNFEPGDTIAAFVPELPYIQHLQLESTNLGNEMDVKLEHNNDGISFSFFANHAFANNANPTFDHSLTYDGRGIQSALFIKFTAEQDSQFTLEAENQLDSFTTLPTLNELLGSGSSIQSIFNFYQLFSIQLVDINNDETLFAFHDNILPDTVEGNLLAGSEYALNLFMTSDGSSALPLPGFGLSAFSDDDYDLEMNSMADIQFTVTAVPLPSSFLLLVFALSGLRFSRSKL